MEAVIHHRFQNKSLRFRQWSRKGYAIFCSLGKNVTIAVLNMALSIRMTKKNAADGVIDELKSLFDHSKDESEEVLEHEDFQMSESLHLIPSFVKADSIDVLVRKFKIYNPVDTCRQGFSFM